MSSCVVAICRVCGGWTGVGCGSEDHNDSIRNWIDRGDRIDAFPVEEVRAGKLCSCERCRPTNEPSDEVAA